MDEFPKVFIVGADNVGSKQMQQIRISLRSKGELLMGKNTMMRKAIRGHLENNPDLEKYLKIIFCNALFCNKHALKHGVRFLINLKDRLFFENNITNVASNKKITQIFIFLIFKMYIYSTYYNNYDLKIFFFFNEDFFPTSREMLVLSSPSKI